MELKEAPKKSKREMKREKQQLKQKKGEDEPKEVEQQQEGQQGEDFDLNQVQGGEEVEVSFVIASLHQQHYHSLKTILLRYSQITKCNLSELTDAVLQNPQLGNISLAEDDQSAQEDEDDGEDDENNVYSVLTILPGANKVSKSIKKNAIQSISHQPQQQAIKAVLDKQATQVVINERLPNLPPFLANSYHQIFKQDLLTTPSLLKQVSGDLLIVSEVEVEGKDKRALDQLIFKQFQNYEMCREAKYWWLGASTVSHKKSQMTNLYILIDSPRYLNCLDNIKKYLE